MIKMKKQIFRHFRKQKSTSTLTADANTKRSDIPRPSGIPLLGTTLSLAAAGGGSRLHEYIDRRHKQLGNTFCENMNGNDIVFTSNAEYMRILFIKLEGKYPAHILPEPWILYNRMYGMKRGLFFMDGEEWLHHRKVLNKLVLKEGSERWLEGPITHITKTLIQKLKSKADNGVVVPELEKEFYRHSIDVIVSILTGDSAADKTDKFDVLLGTFAESVQNIFKTTTKMYVWPSLYARLNLAAWRNFKESVDTSLMLARKLVTEIVMLKESKGDGLVKKLMDENMSEENITRIIADFVIAAGDTTSYTLLWILYLLANNPHVVTEWREKRNTKFLHYIVKESMRLYPVAPFLTRIISNECSLGPYLLKGGTPVVASIYTSGRSTSYFSEPFEFIPQRWDRDEAIRNCLPMHTAAATLPFALGARSCIGKKIAQLQLVQVLKEVMDNFDLKPLNKQKVDAVMSQVLVPKDPINIMFVDRSRALI